ncbi:DUF5412 family protein [Thermoanaerobacterium thermosaccharolyticum]|uniref:Uncharacterized protein n=1 Tax=Thermoanaerobacterium thermosaccharolyticum TaxID=1517 RepID=A0A231VL17_THETR|nr:DUF5412 family protein [Thermoanaerobacterium thermosaccharolyticum]OXT08860.1 hypothetical protein CE561_03675 [Thermoanaerobacterium thermosaccharolyticum]
MGSWFYKNKYIVHVGLLIIYTLWALNYFYPVIRFQFSIFNQIFSLSVQLIPLVLLINGFRFKHIFVKIMNSVISIIFSLIGALVAFIILIGIFTVNPNEAFMLIQKVQINSNFIVVYRTNGGATTDYGIVVRQEKEIVKGVLLVKDLYRKYHMYDVSIKKLGDNKVEIDDEKIYIKRNVYLP